MKILHYINTFSKSSVTFVYDQIVNLEKIGIDNYILTQKRELKKERPFDEDKIYVVKERKRYLIEKIFHKFVYWRKYNFRNPRDFLKVIKNINPDVIHAHFGASGVFMKKLIEKSKLNIPLVISFHGTDIISQPALDFTYRQEIKNLRFYSDLICTTQTDFLNKKMIGFGILEEKIRTVNNTFNKSFFEVRKSGFFKKGNKFKIINIARFVNWKGQKYLLRAFKEFVENSYSNAELTFIGEGDKRKEMEKLAKDLGIREKVNFLGLVEHGKIPKILKEHDVYVQPSIKDDRTYQEESFGVVILEAIAVGLPVIVTNTGGMSETIIQENGQFSFVVAEKDPEAICKILRKMVGGEYQFKNNKDYANKVMEKFSPEKQINTTIKIYKELINKNENL